jgi:hypothetical protein
MAPILRSTSQNQPRLDLTQDELFHLCIFYIYVSVSAEAVATLMNKCFRPRLTLTDKNVQDTYLHLHDTENEMWIRAKDMNRREKEMLKSILSTHGVGHQLLEVDVIKPVASMACLRVSQQGVRRSIRKC